MAFSLPDYYPGEYPITPNLLLGLWGMDEAVAIDFIKIDQYLGALKTSIDVNGVPVTSPNFINSGTATFSVVGSDVSVTVIAGAAKWADLLGDLTETQVIPWDGPTPGTKDTVIWRSAANTVSIGLTGSTPDASGTLVVGGVTSNEVDITNSYNGNYKITLWAGLFAYPSGLLMSSDSAIQWGNNVNWTAGSIDTSITRASANVVQIGNTSGTPDASGTLQLHDVQTDIIRDVGGSLVISGQGYNYAYISSCFAFENFAPVINSVPIAFGTGNAEAACDTFISRSSAGVVAVGATAALGDRSGRILASSASPDWSGAGDSLAAFDCGPSGYSTGIVMANGIGLGIVAYNNLCLLVDYTGGFLMPSAGAFKWCASGGNLNDASDTILWKSAPNTISIGKGDGSTGDASGTLKLTTVQMAASSGAPTSTGTAGTEGQIIYYGGLAYLCSVTGAAGSAVWNKLQMTAV
jgi:hypothetical protein